MENEGDSQRKGRKEGGTEGEEKRRRRGGKRGGGKDQGRKGRRKGGGRRQEGRRKEKEGRKGRRRRGEGKRGGREEGGGEEGRDKEGKTEEEDSTTSAFTAVLPKVYPQCCLLAQSFSLFRFKSLYLQEWRQPLHTSTCPTVSPSNPVATFSHESHTSEERMSEPSIHSKPFRKQHKPSASCSNSRPHPAPARSGQFLSTHHSPVPVLSSSYLIPFPQVSKSYHTSRTPSLCLL